MGDFNIRSIGGGGSANSLEDAVVTLKPSSFVYDGTAKRQEIASVTLYGETLQENEHYVVLNDTATDAGTHTLSVLGIMDYGGVVTKNWTIAKLSLAKPTVSGSYTYNGSAQNVSLSNFNSSRETKGGTTSATNAGNYTLSVSLNDGNNTQWENGSNTPIYLDWSIAKAQGSVNVSPATLAVIGSAGTTATATVIKTGDGAISANSSNTGVATVSVSGNTITVTSVAAGSCTINISMAAGTNYTGASCSLSVTVTTTRVFGVMWNYGNSSTALTHLTTSNDPYNYVTTNITSEPSPAVGTGSGSSPFDAYAPWKDMAEYNIINNAISYKKGTSGFSRSSNDTVVYIPVFYFKIVDADSKRYFYIADNAISGFTKHPGSGRYVGRYTTASGYVTKSGLAPLTSITRATARSNSANKGSKWWQWDVATWNAIQMLYIVEFADWDSQSKIGKGFVDGSSSSDIISSGGTDSMTYHTGRASGTDGKTAVQYRWIENPWGNVYQWIDGINEYGTDLYVCTNPSNFADSTSTNYAKAGFTLPGNDGYITKLGYDSVLSWLLFASAYGGSSSTYIPDYAFSGSSSSWYVVPVGGGYGNGTFAGLFCADYNTASSSDASVGSRLLFIP